MKNFNSPIDEMLYILIKESEQVMPDNLSEKDKRWLIDSLISVRAPGYVNERFRELHDELLKKENELNPVDCILFRYRKRFAVTRSDVLSLKVDAVVCGALDYVGAMNPNLKCMDNRLVIRGGLGLREQCNEVNIENGYLCRPGTAFCVSGGCLLCNYVVKMILPRVDNIVQYDVDKVKSCIVSAMDILREKGIKSFAVDLVLDPMFNIPKDMYARIVISTISSYMKQNKWKVNCVLVVDDDLLGIVKDILKVKITY